MPKKFRRIPREVEAEQIREDNAAEIAIWCDGRFVRGVDGPVIFVRTLNGEVRAHEGDWIIKGVQGDFYPCANSVFIESYEPA